jgi:hypothetical protein
MSAAEILPSLPFTRRFSGPGKIPADVEPDDSMPEPLARTRGIVILIPIYKSTKSVQTTSTYNLILYFFQLSSFLSFNKMASFSDDKAFRLTLHRARLDLVRHNSAVSLIVRLNAAFVASIAILIGVRLYVRVRIVRRFGSDDSMALSSL